MTITSQKSTIILQRNKENISLNIISKCAPNLEHKGNSSKRPPRDPRSHQFELLNSLAHQLRALPLNHNLKKILFVGGEH